MRKLTEQEKQAALALAQRLSERMKCIGMTQAALGNACGVSRAAVSNWVRTGQIYHGHLPAIADNLGVTIDWLLRGKGGDSPADRAWLEKAKQLAPDDRRHLERFTDAMLVARSESSTDAPDGTHG